MSQAPDRLSIVQADLRDLLTEGGLSNIAGSLSCRHEEVRHLPGDGVDLLPVKPDKDLVGSPSSVSTCTVVTRGRWELSQRSATLACRSSGSTGA